MCALAHTSCFFLVFLPTKLFSHVKYKHSRNVTMSMPTVGQNTQAMQQPVNPPDVFRCDALSTRFLAYPANASVPCANPMVMPATAHMAVPNPCCADASGDMLGMARNNDILRYQFGALPNPNFCGVPVSSCDECGAAAQTQDCAACPCQAVQGCTTNTGAPTACDYGGFARNHSYIFAPGAIGRSGLNRWG